MKITNLHFGYRKGRPLLDGLNLELSSGHVYGLLGDNGAVKTTLLKIMAGLCFPGAGTVEVLGFKPAERNLAFLREIFLMPEAFGLPNISVDKYVEHYSIFYPRFDRSLFTRLIQQFSLNHKALLPILSQGQKKLFMIAYALSTRAKILLLDEPTNGLDIPNKQAWQSILMQEIRDDQLVLISTHQVHDIASLIDGVMMMKEGKILINALMADIETKLDCGVEKKAPAPDSVFYSELTAGGYSILRANKGEEASQIDLTLLFQALLQNTQISKLFNGGDHV